MDHMKNHMDNLSRNWRMMGRPTLICPVNAVMLGQILCMVLEIIFLSGLFARFKDVNGNVLFTLHIVNHLIFFQVYF